MRFALPSLAALAPIGPTYVDQVTLPADGELPPALIDFRKSFGRPTALARLAKLEKLGLNLDSDLERHLERRVTESNVAGAVGTGGC